MMGLLGLTVRRVWGLLTDSSTSLQPHRILGFFTLDLPGTPSLDHHIAPLAMARVNAARLNAIASGNVIAFFKAERPKW